MSRILILPGDVQYNLGDTAICLALVATLQCSRDDYEIQVLGEPPSLEDDFVGIEFCRWNHFPGLLFAAKADAVLWGGGQLLQGNRSRLKIPLWFIRIAWLRLLRRRIFGVAQGIGPLASRLDRWMTRTLVSWTERFSVRDSFSERELRDSRVPRERIERTADPALLLPRLLAAGRVTTESDDAPDLRSGETPASPQLGLSLRFTLHHRDSRLIPFQMLSRSVREKALQAAGFDKYLLLIQELIERLARQLKAKIVLVPMYRAPWESDRLIAQAVHDSLLDKGLEVEVFEPGASLGDLLAALGHMEAFIGTPMHSTILSTAMNVPTCSLYYEAKGLSYFEAIGAQEWAYPLKRLTTEESSCELEELIVSLWARRAAVRKQLFQGVSTQESRVAEFFENLLDHRPAA